MNPARNKTTDRHAADFYPTPQALADAICLRLRRVIGDVWKVLEPSAGDGTFMRAARLAWGVDTVIQGIEKRQSPDGVLGCKDACLGRFNCLCYGEQGTTFEEWCAGFDPKYDSVPEIILGNPPFSLWERHARLALERLPEGGHLAFLLRASALAGKKRVNGLWREHPPKYVWHVAPRPSFTGDGKTDGAEYAVVVWQKGHTGPYEGGWLTWDK